MKKAPRRRIVDELMAEHIHMPGFPQVVVTRSFAYQYLKKLGWPGLGPHGSGLDYSVLAVARKTDEPLTDPEVRDYHLSAPEVVKGLSHNPAHGIQFVLGIHDRRPRGPRGGTTELQSVMFDKDIWTKPDAARWCKEHDLKSALVESQANFWRFEQKPSKLYERFSVIEAGARNPDWGWEVREGAITADERDLLTHVERFGSDGCPVHKVRSGWTWGTENVKGPPTVFKTKKGAVASFEAWLEAKSEAKRGKMQQMIREGRWNPAGRSRTGRGNPSPLSKLRRYWAARKHHQFAHEEAKLLVEYGVSSLYKEIEPYKGFKVLAWVDGTYTSGLGTDKVFTTLEGLCAYIDRKLVKTRKRNPSSAAALYEEFHGQPPDETLEFRDKIREHDQLAELGALVEMKIRTLTKLAATLRFDGDAPLLCSSPDGRQLYLQGGDQSLDLRSLKMDGEEWRKDSMTIGVIDELTYGTAKKFHHFKLTDYWHRLGEESGVQPFLLYDPVNKLMAVTGGQYRTGEPGIEN